jgi:cyclic beta-1,2-glucan synthetase
MRMHMTELRKLGRRLDALCQKGDPDLLSVYDRLAGEGIAAAHPFIARSVSNGCWWLAQLSELPEDCANGDPRVLVVAQALLSHPGPLTREIFAYRIDELQQSELLTAAEVYALIPAVRISYLLQLAEAFGSRESRVNNDKAYHAVTALWDLSKIDSDLWIRDLFPCDAILQHDPANAYAHMDVWTKETYRLAAGRLANKLKCKETEVSSAALELARKQSELTHNNTLPQCHVGYYLCDDGSGELAASINPESSRLSRVRAVFRAGLKYLYLLCQPILAVVVASCLWNIAVQGPLAWWSSAALGAGLLIVGWQAASQVAFITVTFLKRPERLPKLDFEAGIPPDQRVAIIIPAILVSENQVEQLVSCVESQYRQHSTSAVSWVVLTDLPESRTSPLADHDDALVRLCFERVSKLNEKYASLGPARFAFLHRRRQFNARERVWMGWERKRGAIEDLFRYVTQRTDAFVAKSEQAESLIGLKYAVVLDEDASVPVATLERLIGTICHPLNRAVIDPVSRRIVRGHGLVEPRMVFSQQSRTRWRLFDLVFDTNGKEGGYAPTPNSFQDLFGEAIFVGKGVYDVEAYVKVLSGRMPENLVLGHDIVEGAYLRPALASDVVAFEEFPHTYQSLTLRRHRWTRADWQNMVWLSPLIWERGKIRWSPIPLICRWSMLDRVRVDLIEITYCSLLIAGWLTPAVRPGALTAALLLLFVATWDLGIGIMLVSKILKGAVGDGVNRARTMIAAVHLRAAVFFISAPHQALIAADGISRSTWRLLARKRLLAWTITSQLDRERKSTIVDLYFFVVRVLGLLILLITIYKKPGATWYVSLFIFLWFASKPIAAWFNKQDVTQHSTLRWSVKR